MLVIKEQTSLLKIKELAQESFVNLVKAVVDVEKKILVVGGELHSDMEAVLLEMGSKQENLWGINIYPEANEDEFIEFDSMINVRPSMGNRTRRVEDPFVREKILGIVKDLIVR
ncbi:MAG: DUF5674 family protein [bacterium]